MSIHAAQAAPPPVVTSGLPAPSSTIGGSQPAVTDPLPSSQRNPTGFDPVAVDAGTASGGGLLDSIKDAAISAVGTGITSVLTLGNMAMAKMEEQIMNELKNKGEVSQETLFKSQRLSSTVSLNAELMKKIEDNKERAARVIVS